MHELRQLEACRCGSADDLGSTDVFSETQEQRAGVLASKRAELGARADDTQISNLSTGVLGMIVDETDELDLAVGRREVDHHLRVAVGT